MGNVDTDDEAQGDRDDPGLLFCGIFFSCPFIFAARGLLIWVEPDEVLKAFRGKAYELTGSSGT